MAPSGTLAALGWRQDLLYNGHYGGHGFKYQIIVSACGIIESCEGPFAGRHHDAWMVRETELEAELSSFCASDHDIPNPNWFIYGDAAYPRGTHIQKPILRAFLSAEDEDANARWSAVRISVEHIIGNVSAVIWQALDFKRQEKVGLSSVALRYRVGVFLMNCLTCMRGKNVMSAMYHCPPPPIEVYLGPEEERM